MKAYLVHRPAAMAGCSVRTLHHHDQIGLLKPSSRTEKGCRQYAQADLLRLQQILFYREPDLPLREIRRALDEPGADPGRALNARRCATIEVFYEVTAEIYRGLGQRYRDDPRFGAAYDRFKPGPADFMRPAMEDYAGHTLAKK